MGYVMEPCEWIEKPKEGESDDEDGERLWKWLQDEWSRHRIARIHVKTQAQQMQRSVPSSDQRLAVERQWPYGYFLVQSTAFVFNRQRACFSTPGAGPYTMPSDTTHEIHLWTDSCRPWESEENNQRFQFEWAKITLRGLVIITQW